MESINDVGREYQTFQFHTILYFQDDEIPQHSGGYAFISNFSWFTGHFRFTLSLLLFNYQKVFTITQIKLFSSRCCQRFFKRCCCLERELKARTIYVGRPVFEKYPANVIRNQKYNIITFLPLVRRP